MAEAGGGTRLIGLRNSKALVSGANWVPPAEIDEIDEKLTALADWVTDDKQSGMLHPIEKAAIFHAEFIRIHPFFDGNGRTGRIMANYLLIVDEFPSIAIKQRFDKDKTEKPYFEALDKAIMTHEIDDLIGLFYKECYRSAKNLHMCFDAVEESQNIEKTNSL